MNYTSTRSACAVSSSEAVLHGIADDGGLFVPLFFPRLPREIFSLMTGMNYIQRAETVLRCFLTDYPQNELHHCVTAAYNGPFGIAGPAPLREVEPGMHLLELWHGPTCAFKDVALQLLPHLLTSAAGRIAPGRKSVILVATSGDTGKAALEGFADVPGTEIIVFYPCDGVSEMQKLQMVTQTGKNVSVCAIEGNFDHAQRGVKQIFADASIKSFLEDGGMSFSSANSINFGRLAPQIVYYVSAYCDLIATGKIRYGEEINIAVPTGNFGNILAAVYASELGVPVKRFICASNRNRVLTDFIRTGVYDCNREFYLTDSPSMDILISSNLERMLHLLAGGDYAEVRRLMSELKNSGRYQIPAEMLARLQRCFYAGCCDDRNTGETIADLFRRDGYLCDTHTAVPVNVYRQYLAETGDSVPCVIASTASPYKFAPAVLRALGDGGTGGGFSAMDELHRISGVAIPRALAGLKDRPALHCSRISKDDMPRFVRDVLAGRNG